MPSASTTQLHLFEILTKSSGIDDIDENENHENGNRNGINIAESKENRLASFLKEVEEDYTHVTIYLSNHTNSTVIVKLGCQTLEKVGIKYVVQQLIWNLIFFHTTTPLY